MIADYTLEIEEIYSLSYPSLSPKDLRPPSESHNDPLIPESSGLGFLDTFELLLVNPTKENSAEASMPVLQISNYIKN